MKLFFLSSTHKTRQYKRWNALVIFTQMSFKCPKCSKTFACRFNLYRHVDNKALPCDFQCDQCPHKSQNKYEYYFHKQHEHSAIEKVERQSPESKEIPIGNQTRGGCPTPLNIWTRTQKKKVVFRKHMLSNSVSEEERNDAVPADMYPIRDVTPGELANLSQSDKVFVLILRN